MHLHYVKFLITIFIFASQQLVAQDTLIAKTIDQTTMEYFDNEIVDFPDKEPAFPGGLTAISEWAFMRIPFPEDDFGNKIETTIKVKFIVEKNGALSNITFEGLTEDIRISAYLISRMPKWIPAKVDGKPVRCRSSFKLDFSLN